MENGQVYKLKCGEHSCKRKINLTCINPSTMESVVTETNKYIDIRNTQWKCLTHALKSRKKNYHRYKK